MQTERAVRVHYEPAIEWRLFDSETTDQVHVIPCTKAGEPMKPHEPTPWCSCQPWRDDIVPHLYVHDVVQ